MRAHAPLRVLVHGEEQPHVAAGDEAIGVLGDPRLDADAGAERALSHGSSS
jgi:hypothetical protein